MTTSTPTEPRETHRAPAPRPASRLPTSPAEIKLLIASRKRVDRVFGVVGMLCILFALVTLGALLIDLAIDGVGRLTETHLVKPDGTVPGRREIAGTFIRQGDAFVLSPVRVRVNADQNLSPLVDQRLMVEVMPAAGNTEVDAADLKTFRPGDDTATATATAPAVVAPGGVATELGRRGTAGTIAARTLGGFVFVPDPLRVTASPDGIDLAAFGDEPVAVEGSRSATEGTVRVDEVSRFVPKSFFTSMPSREPNRAGILSAWVGTMLVMLVTAAAALPLGIAAGIYLEEYARKNKLTALIEINIANLAGVPSIIWGLMALGLFVYLFHLGHSVATAGLTLGLLVLPIVIIATREAIRSVPATIREASIALGATKWQTVRNHIIPYSMSGILTGSIIGLSRAIGETAPLITIGALTYIPFLPPPPVQFEPELSVQPFAWLTSPFTVMPIQMFNWTSRPDPAFHRNAAAAGVVLVALTLAMNAVAIVLRYRLRKRIKW